jgi:hypothetical protein
MYNEHYRVTHKSWFQRILESYAGMVFGFILLLVACIVLWYNEYRTVNEAENLEYTKNEAVSIDASSILPENDGKLVHLNGNASTEIIMEDPDFGIAIKALRIRRNAEMFQWKERQSTIKQENQDGSQTSITRYSYHPVWSSTLISSYNFDDRSYYNPDQFPIQGYIENSSEVTLGAFTISKEFVNQLDQWIGTNIPDTAYPNMANQRLYPSGSNNLAYIGRGTLDRPEVGDVRISFDIIPPSTISAMGAQNGNQLTQYSRDDNNISYLNYGTLTINDMIKAGEEDNASTTLALRITGTIMMIISFFLILRPIAIMGKPIPLVSSLLSIGTNLLSLVLGLSLSASVIGTSWLFYKIF